MSDNDYLVSQVSGRIYKESSYQQVLPVAKKERSKTSSENPGRAVDDVDLKIIKFLAADSRMTLSAIAQKLEIGTSTVYKRLSRLINEGVIRGFTILADNEKLGLGAAAFIGISCSNDKKEAIKKYLLDIREVVEIHEVLEPFDLLVKVRSTDVKALKEGPMNSISQLEGVDSVKPILVVNTVKEALYNV